MSGWRLRLLVAPTPPPLMTEYTLKQSLEGYPEEGVEPASLTGKGRDLGDTLLEHGEVQARMASGEQFSFHLGDRGYFTSDKLCIRLANGDLYHLYFDQVESFWTHRASKEG